MNQTGANSITKNDAAQWLNINRRSYPTERIIDLIYRVTVCGEEYAVNSMDPYMSYICRLYNITAYGASKQQNRIKGRYAKYRNLDDIKGVIANIIRKSPNGFQTESPRFDDLLKDYYLSVGTAAQQMQPKQVQARAVQQRQIQPRSQVQPRQMQPRQAQMNSGNANVFQSNVANLSQANTSEEGTGTDIVYVMFVFSVALLVRWFISGTIWGAWYRKVITVLIGFLAFGGAASFFEEWNNPANSSKKGITMTFMLVSIGLVLYSVCNFPGHWLSRIITGFIGACLSAGVATAFEDK